MKKLFAIATLIASLNLVCQCSPKVPTAAYSDLEWKDDVFFLAGKPFSGVATAEYSPGKPKGEYPLKSGRLHGLVKEWWENAQPSVETNFDNGQRHGSNKYWRKDGTLMKEQIYDHDNPVKTTHYDEHGKAIPEEKPTSSAANH